jgi:hypothetical protein
MTIHSLSCLYRLRINNHSLCVVFVVFVFGHSMYLFSLFIDCCQF